AAPPTLPVAPVAPASTAARYNHPLFVRAERVERVSGGCHFYFKAFTGYEPEPVTPRAVYSDETLTSEQRRELGEQYEAALIIWSKARLRRVAEPLLRKAAPLWAAWTAARNQMQTAFQAFWQIEDGRWKAQLLRLTDAERAAAEAAQAWDEIAQQLAQAADDQVRAAGYDNELELDKVARELGLDSTDWAIQHINDYLPGRSWGEFQTPLVSELQREIKAQRARLREVAELAGRLT
ncbi:hypothetical protein, partial [Streptomyces palmae]